MASEAILFHSSPENAYAQIPVSGRKETWSLDSRRFERWLLRQYYERTGKAPGKNAIQDAINVLKGRALFDGDQIPVYVRLARHEDKIYLDLGDEAWTVIEVDEQGWRVVADPPVRFRRSNSTRSLPYPQRGGCLNELRQFINAPTDDLWVLAVSWLVGAFRPEGPYAFLILQGEQGCAKTSTSETLMKLIDPSKGLVRTLPSGERDLMISAENSHVLGFDNLSGLTMKMSDTLCRLSTGAGLATRTLYQDREEEVFEVARPVILNGIEDIAQRDDLAQRSIILHLPSIEAGQRKTKAEMEHAFAEVAPRIFGSLLDAVSAGLRNLPHTRLEHPPRMADFAVWVAACEEALPWEAGTFMEYHTENRRQAIGANLESHTVATGLIQFMEGRTEWEGTATELYNLIEREVEGIYRKKDWPDSPKWLSGRLKQVTPALRQGAGLDVHWTRKNDEKRTRLLQVSRIE